MFVYGYCICDAVAKAGMPSALQAASAFEHYSRSPFERLSTRTGARTAPHAPHGRLRPTLLSLGPQQTKPKAPGALPAAQIPHPKEPEHACEQCKPPPTPLVPQIITVGSPGSRQSTPELELTRRCRSSARSTRRRRPSIRSSCPRRSSIRRLRARP